MRENNAVIIMFEDEAIMGHFVTQEDIFNNLPGLDYDESDPIACKRLIGTRLPWQWYLICGNKEDDYLIAYVKGFENESGSVLGKDLLDAGCIIDHNYTPKRLSEIH